MSDFEIRLLDLSKLDVEALQRATGKKIETETTSGNPKESRELMTLVAIGGLGLVSAAASYYFGKRKSDEVMLDVEVRTKDGTFTRARLYLKSTDTVPVDTQIMSQIGKILAGGSA